MPTKLPPPPIQGPPIGIGGLIQHPWTEWFRQAFVRMGGSTALSNDEIAARFPVQAIDIGDAQVTEVKLAASVAGNGLSGGAGSALAVNVDGSTLEINSDALRVRDAGITLAKLATSARSVLQDIVTLSGAVATGTTTIPFDDTIPQSTEGTEFLTATITPTSSTSRLVIEAVVHLSSNTAARYLIAALFQDSGANALAAASSYAETVSGPRQVVLLHEMAAGTTSATTFRVRAGADSAATVTLNGVAGARRFGGITVSSLRVQERAA